MDGCGWVGEWAIAESRMRACVRAYVRSRVRFVRCGAISWKLVSLGNGGRARARGRLSGCLRAVWLMKQYPVAEDRRPKTTMAIGRFASVAACLSVCAFVEGVGERANTKV